MAKGRGYIKLYRVGANWKDDELFSKEPLCKWAAWVDLISLAEYQDGQMDKRGVTVETKRGCVYMSIRDLASRWRWSTNKVTRFLALLNSNGKTETQKSNVIGCISILNYDKYQGDEYTGEYTDEYTDEYTESRQESEKRRHIKTIVTNCVTTLSDERCQGDGDTDGDTESDDDFVKNPKNEYTTKNINKASLKETNKEKAAASKKNIAAVKEACREIRDFYNSELDAAQARMPRLCSELTGQRQSWFVARLKQYGKESVKEVIRKAARSDFLNGDGAKGFRANFGWLMRPNNFPKVLDGNYDNFDQNQNKTANGNYQQTDRASRLSIAELNHQRQLERDRRRGTGVPDAKPEDYHTSF